MACAMATCEIPMGFRYSSARISPGVMGFSMVTRYIAAKFSSMVVNYGNLLGTGISPSKDDPPLVVNPDGMKTGQIPPERLQPIAGRNRQIRNRSGLIHLDELAQRYALDGRKRPATFGMEQFCSIPVCK